MIPLVSAVVAGILAGVGSLAAVANERWWVTIHQPSFTPPLTALRALWITAHMALGGGVALAAADDGGLVWVLGGVSVAAALLWPFVLFGLRSVRNGFFVISVAWVPAALTALAAAVRTPIAGALSGVFVALLTVAAVWSFVLWQINEPTRY